MACRRSAKPAAPTERAPAWTSLAPCNRAPIQTSAMNAAAPRVRRGKMRALLKLARPYQWLKNGLVLAALVFSHRLFVAHDFARAMVALAAFCALSSAAYVLNDIFD